MNNSRDLINGLIEASEIYQIIYPTIREKPNNLYIELLSRLKYRSKHAINL